jgi:hypothetical protein
MATPRNTAAPTAGARSAAQQAFFQAALGGQAVATPRAPVTAAPPRMTRAPDLTIQMPREEPAKILKPGSIINIVV